MAKRIAKRTRTLARTLEALGLPSVTPEDHERAVNAMKPYLGTFQAAANEQTDSDFGAPPAIDQPPETLFSKRIPSGRFEVTLRAVTSSQISFEDIGALIDVLESLVRKLQTAGRDTSVDANPDKSST